MKEFDLIIKNGTVVTSTESFLCDVAVKDGKIAAMAQNIEADAKEIYDAAGKLVLPGALDAHTHMANFGRMMDFIKAGDDAQTALDKAKGQYGRVDDAVKIIDPRKE